MSKLTELQKAFIEIDRKIRNGGNEKQLKERHRILKAIAEEKKAQIFRQAEGYCNEQML